MRVRQPTTAKRLIAAVSMLALSGCGGGTATSGTGGVPVPTPSPTATGDAPCVAGNWSIAATDPDDGTNLALPVQYETTHFAFHWKGDLVSLADAQAAGEHLEYVWGEFVGRIGFPQPDCRRPDKRKANIYIAADYGLSGGADLLGQMGMWIGPGGVRDRFGLAHEFAHALQAMTGAYRS